MPVVPAASWTKRIQHPAPYHPVTLNEHTAELFGEGGVLRGMNVVPASATSITVYPGSFITSLGISVELLDTFAISIDTSLPAPYVLYAITNDEIDDEVTLDVVDAASAPAGSVILAWGVENGKWARRHAFGIGDTWRHIKGGLHAYTQETSTVAASTQSITMERFEYDDDLPLTAMVFAAGLRLHRYDDLATDQYPTWQNTGRRTFDLTNNVGGSPTNWSSGTDFEAFSTRDIVFQSDQLANGSETQFFFPVGETIEPDSNEILVFVDGVLQSTTTYTEASDSVTLDTLYPSGSLISLVKISPIFFREEILGSAFVAAQPSGDNTVYRLTLNTYVTIKRSIMVFVNGLKQVYPLDFTEDDGETIQFVTALADIDNIVVIGIRSAVGGGIDSITPTSPITGGGTTGDVPIGFDFDAVDAETAPPPIGATGGVGVDDNRFARRFHFHQESFPLTSVSGTVLLPLGTVSGGSVGGSGEAADALHQHPTEGGLITTPDRTVEISLDPHVVDRIPAGASILSSVPIIPAGVRYRGDHHFLVLPGVTSTSTKYDSGFRVWWTLPMDYVDGTNWEIRFNYEISIGHTEAGGGSIYLAAHVTIDDAEQFTNDALILTPTAVDDDTLTLSAASFIVVPGSGTVPGSRVRIDIARNKTLGSDNYVGDLRVCSLLAQYDG